MADAADVLFAQSDNSLAFHPGPNPSRQSVSKGSVDHGSGACRPCAWLYKSRNGCRHGEKCDYCHMCPPGELKRKKRDKLARRAEEMRQQRLQELQQGATSTAVRTPSAALRRRRHAGAGVLCRLLHADPG
ncbi:unnamed protein product, partial [Polarella glacialis]